MNETNCRSFNVNGGSISKRFPIEMADDMKIPDKVERKVKTALVIGVENDEKKIFTAETINNCNWIKIKIRIKSKPTGSDKKNITAAKMKAERISIKRVLIQRPKYLPRIKVDRGIGFERIK